MYACHLLLNHFDTQLHKISEYLTTIYCRHSLFTFGWISIDLNSLLSASEQITWVLLLKGA